MERYQVVVFVVSVGSGLSACGGSDSSDAGGTTSAGGGAMTGAANVGAGGGVASAATSGGGPTEPTCAVPCAAGEMACVANDNCEADLLCFRNTCVPPDCLLFPQLIGCGYEGALCGACAIRPTCTETAECPAGQVCPEGNGWRYGLVDLDVCEPAGGCTGPCGSTTSECGLCEGCIPDCEGQVCGSADLDDGCGDRCVATCMDGQVGCELDIDCQPGSACFPGNVCRPAVCLLAQQPPDCGTEDSPCGPCPRPPNVCVDRECGEDPATGDVCPPGCEENEFCNGAGRCVPLASD